MWSSRSLNDAVDVPTNVFLKFVYSTIRISIDLPIFSGSHMEISQRLLYGTMETLAFIFANGEHLHTSGVCMHGKAWATGVWYRISWLDPKSMGEFWVGHRPNRRPWKMVIYNIWDHMQQPVGHEMTNRTYVQKVQILESRWIVLQVTPQKRYGPERSSEIYMPWWSCSPLC